MIDYLAHGLADVSGHVCSSWAASTDWDMLKMFCSFTLMLSVLAGICYVLRRRSLGVRLRCCAYIVALVSTQLLMKMLTSPVYGYAFPATVTASHFFCVWLLCVVHFASQNDLVKCSPHSIGSLRRYFTHVVPAAGASFPSVVLSNQALLYIGAGLSAAVATLAPVFTTVLCWCCGRTFTWGAWAGIAIACTGAIVVGFGEFREHSASEVPWYLAARGLTLAFSSVFFRAVKVVLQDMLLKPSAYLQKQDMGDLKSSYGAMHVWALQAPPCFIMAAVYATLVEDQHLAWVSLNPGVVTMILATCLSACALNLLAMCAIRDLGGSMMSIVGKLNTVVVMAFSMALLEEQISEIVLLGAGMVLAGVYQFEVEGSAQRADQDSERLPLLK